MIKWIIGNFIKQSEIILSEGKAKWRVKGVTIGIFLGDFCVMGIWRERYKFDSVGLIWMNKGIRLIAEITQEK